MEAYTTGLIDIRKLGPEHGPSVLKAAFYALRNSIANGALHNYSFECRRDKRGLLQMVAVPKET